VQITVVATGFDAERVKESPMEKMSRLSIERNKNQGNEEKEKNKITFPSQGEHKMIIEEKVQPKPQRIFTQAEKALEDEDDELEIPAFIRRKMGK
jgi:hypothetical protein